MISSCSCQIFLETWRDALTIATFFLFFSQLMPCHMTELFKLGGSGPQRYGFSSSSCPQPAEKEADDISDERRTVDEEDSSLLSNSSCHVDPANESAETSKDDGSRNAHPRLQKRRRRRSFKRTAFSDSDAEPEPSSIDDLVKLVADKEELLKQKHKEIEKMQEKVLLSYADMENVIDRTKREAENSKKFAIQVCFLIYTCHIYIYI